MTWPSREDPEPLWMVFESMCHGICLFFIYHVVIPSQRILVISKQRNPKDFLSTEVSVIPTQASPEVIIRDFTLSVFSCCHQNKSLGMLKLLSNVDKQVCFWLKHIMLGVLTFIHWYRHTLVQRLWLRNTKPKYFMSNTYFCSICLWGYVSNVSKLCSQMHQQIGCFSTLWVSGLMRAD